MQTACSGTSLSIQSDPVLVQRGWWALVLREEPLLALEKAAPLTNYWRGNERFATQVGEEP